MEGPYSPNLSLLQGDMMSSESLLKVVRTALPDEVYNLAAISYMPYSWQCPTLTMDVNGAGVTRLLEAVRSVNPSARFYQASSSEMFGHSGADGQDETTPFRPVHPYAAAKLAGHWAAVNFREQYRMHISCGILFNHESPRRSRLFLTRKVTRYAACVSLHLAREKLVLWTLDPVRDWGFSGDYVRAMWLMLQQDRPGDYCIGSGKGHTVGDFVRMAFEFIGAENWREHITLNPPENFVVDKRANFVCKSTTARDVLGFVPEYDLNSLVKMMVENDILDIHNTLRTARMAMR